MTEIFVKERRARRLRLPVLHCGPLQGRASQLHALPHVMVHCILCSPFALHPLPPADALTRAARFARSPAFQVFGQALFNTAESHVKYWLVTRQLKAVEAGAQAPRKGPGHPGTIEEADEQDDDDEDADGGALPQTPFEMAPSGGEYLAKKKAEREARRA